MSLEKEVISVFPTREDFLKLLKVNKGLVIVKLGATWCGPCKQIAPIVEAFFATSPPNVICADIDVDESFDLYSFFKSKRMVNGIPVMLCYKRGNYTYAPDDMITGSNPNDLHNFFLRCGKYLQQIRSQDNEKKHSQLEKGGVI